MNAAAAQAWNASVTGLWQAPQGPAFITQVEAEELASVIMMTFSKQDLETALKAVAGPMNLNVVDSETPLQKITQVVCWLNANGAIDNVLTKLLSARPDSYELRSFYQRYALSRSQKLMKQSKQDMPAEVPMSDLYNAAVSAGLFDAREQLFGRVPNSVVASIPTCRMPQAQVMCDMHGVRAAGLKHWATWLRNACMLTTGTRESFVFGAALDAVGARLAAGVSDDDVSLPWMKILVKDAVLRLSRTELETVIFKVSAPRHMLPGRDAPLADIAIELFRWADNLSSTNPTKMAELYAEIKRAGR